MVAISGGCRSLHKVYRQKAWDHWNGEGSFKNLFRVIGACAFVGAGIGGYQEANKDFSYDRAHDVKTGMVMGAACGAVSGAFWPAFPYVVPIVALYKGIVFSSRQKFYKD